MDIRIYPQNIRILENDLNEFNNKNQGLKVQIENLDILEDVMQLIRKLQ